MGKTRTVLTAAAFAICGSASADFFIEIAPLSVGPNSQSDFGAVIGQEEELGIWIWSDTPRIAITALGFDIDGTTTAGTDPGTGDYQFNGLGTADPAGLFTLFSGNGVLSSSNYIDNIDMASLLGVPLTTSADRALLIYDGFAGTPFSFASGALPVVNFVNGLPIDEPITTYGWFQIPAPGSLVILGIGAMISTRQRR